MVARSTQTLPRRGARAAKAAPRATTSSSAPLNRANRRATWTSDVARMPASLKTRSDPSLPRHQPGVEGVDGAAASVNAGTPRSKSSLTASTKAVGGRQDQTPRGRHRVGARRIRRTHAAHEQVEDATEVLVGVIVGQAPAQVAVQRHRVEQGLQRVVGGDHFGLQRGGAVVPGGQRLPRRTQLVGLVVGQDEAVARQAEHEVEAPRQIPPKGPVETGVAQVRGVACHRIVLGQVLVQEVRHSPDVQARRRARRRRPVGSRSSARRAGRPGQYLGAGHRPPSARGGSRWRRIRPRPPRLCCPSSRCARPLRRPAPPTPRQPDRARRTRCARTRRESPCPPVRPRACRPAARRPRPPPGPGPLPAVPSVQRARPRRRSAAVPARSPPRSGRASRW